MHVRMKTETTTEEINAVEETHRLFSKYAILDTYHGTAIIERVDTH